MASLGFGLDRNHVTQLVSRYFETTGKPNPFRDGIPGRYWWVGFLERWKEKLAERKPQHLSMNRAEASNDDVVAGFHALLESVLQKSGLSDLPYHEAASRMWNCDKTGMKLGGCTTKSRVLAAKGSRTVSETSSGSRKEQITALICGSAIGQTLPPHGNKGAEKERQSQVAKIRKGYYNRRGIGQAYKERGRQKTKETNDSAKIEARKKADSTRRGRSK